MSRDLAAVRIHVHDADPHGPDAMLRLLDLVDSASDSLEATLCAMCGETASATRVDICSLYVRERIAGEDVLVMRGNHGFPAHAVGSVRLALDEGITGLVAERMRPVSVASAAEDAHFKYVAGLGEERYPSFLGLPVSRDGVLYGVLVLQRERREAFRPEEVARAAALSVAFSLKLWRAPVVEHPRTARLHGAAVSDGAAMGHAYIVPSLRALTRTASSVAGPSELTGAIARLEAGLARLAARAPGLAPVLTELSLVLADARLRDELTLQTSTHGLAEGLRRAATGYARTPYQVDDLACRSVLADRARNIEELCTVLYLLATQPQLPHGRVVIAEQVGAFTAAWAASQGAGALLSESAIDAETPAGAIALGANLPTVGEVTALFAWVRAGDLLVVDAGHAEVRVNPSEAVIRSIRGGGREPARSGGSDAGRRGTQR